MIRLVSHEVTAELQSKNVKVWKDSSFHKQSAYVLVQRYQETDLSMVVANVAGIKKPASSVPLSFFVKHCEWPRV